MMRRRINGRTLLMDQLEDRRCLAFGASISGDGTTLTLLGTDLDDELLSITVDLVGNVQYVDDSGGEKGDILLFEKK